MKIRETYASSVRLLARTDRAHRQMQRDRDKINRIQICLYARAPSASEIMMIIYAGYPMCLQRVCQQPKLCHLFQ